MTFEEFLSLVHERIGTYCDNDFWMAQFYNLADRSRGAVESELPFLAVRAVGEYYSTHELPNQIFGQKD